MSTSETFSPTSVDEDHDYHDHAYGDEVFYYKFINISTSESSTLTSVDKDHDDHDHVYPSSPKPTGCKGRAIKPRIPGIVKK